MERSTNSDAFKIQTLLMKCTGLWPKRNPSKFYKLYGVVNYVLVLILTLTLLLSTVVVKDFNQLIQAWLLCITTLNICIKFTIFYFKMPTFLELLDFLHSSHFTYYEQKFDHHLNRQIKIAIAMVKLFFSSASVTVIFILTAPLVQNQEVLRLTPIPFPLNLNEQPTVIYLIVYACQCVGLFSAALGSVGHDNLSTSMMGLCSAYFSILQDSIIEGTKKFRKDNDDDKTLKKYKTLDTYLHAYFNECCEHHLAVISFTENIENIFSYGLLSQFLSSAAGICLAGFTFINSDPRSMEFILALSFLGSLMIQITLYCSYGNEVTIQSAMVRDACYMTEWIYCGPLVRKDLFLIMERSKRPMVLTAGKFVNLSLLSLVSIFRSAGSYAMVLYQLYNK